MNIPSVPTDNLYKFLAISGLVLCFLSFFSTIVLVRDIELKIADSEGVVRVAELEKERLNRAGFSLDTFETKNTFVTQRILRHLEQVENARKAVEKLNVLKYQQILHSLLGLAGFITGGVLSIIGFRLWYTRLQIYQDAAIKKDEKYQKNV